MHLSESHAETDYYTYTSHLSEELLVIFKQQKRESLNAEKAAAHPVKLIRKKIAD
ncbi:MAG: hypothetical protein RMZ41_029015 [Nostoc sp. DedVER02]|uniref:hypothetical protein n=1 Tax=unclassified Nostoc TaxID=2593658 RepID=UPI002AD2B029|nr:MULTISPECIES: hypothetical protein [unclassified Nostoc]MDZ7989840.1 hypothetical protein [Nostoc sp. DedVER02]MDZ8111253.1 hypothetical protein [Nostoc sp. DedVER01b]